MKRFLKMGVWRGGKLIDDRYIPEKGEVSVGSSAKNMFALIGSHLPKEHLLFHFHKKHPVIHVIEGMTGQLALDGRKNEPLEALRAKGVKEAQGFSLELPDTARGWVMLADATFFIQVAPKPPPPPRKAINFEGATGLMSALQTPLFGIMLVVGGVEGFGVWAINRRPPIELDMPAQEDLDRFAEIMMPEKPKEEKKTEDDAAKKAAEDAAKKAAEEAKKKAEEDAKKNEEESKKKEEAEASKSDEQRAKEAAERKEKMRQEVAKKGLLSVIGATGGSGALANVFASGKGFGDDIGAALAGAGGIAVATGNEGPMRKGGEGGGGTVGIGDLAAGAGEGGGNVQLAERARKVAPQISIDDSEFETESASVDKENLGKYIRMRIKSVQQCYEKELKRNPTLKGKIVVRFVITTQGRVGEVTIDQNTMGDENVAACIKALITRWTFPIKPEEDAPVSFPFVFQPGG